MRKKIYGKKRKIRKKKDDADVDNKQIDKNNNKIL
jgi:hypothetical protein